MKDIMPNNGQFAMPTLPYEALGKVISKETLSFHHGKHLKAYVDNLNKMLPGSGRQAPQGLCGQPQQNAAWQWLGEPAAERGDP